MIPRKTYLYLMPLCLLLAEGLSSAKAFPVFELPATDGKTYSNENFEEHEFVCIIMYSNHCTISQSFDSLIKKLADYFERKDSVLLLVSPNDEKAIIPDELAFSDVGDSFLEMKIRALKRNFNFPYLYDGSSRMISSQLNAKTTPHAFLFNKERDLIYSGRIGDYNEPENLEKSDLFQMVAGYHPGKETNVVRTKVHGTAIKTKEDVKLADQVRIRYANESVRIRRIKEETLDFFIRYNGSKPSLYHVWTHENKENRENLLALSGMFKVFRKRGVRFYTVNLDEDERLGLASLENAQLSATNFLLSGNEVKNLLRHIPEGSTRTTPFTVIFDHHGKVIYAKIGLLDPLICKELIVETLKD